MKTTRLSLAIWLLLLACSVGWLGASYAADVPIPAALPGGEAGVFNEGNASVDVATGVLRAAIPFQVPEARGPVQPQLGLFYSSAKKPAEAGIGWGLNLPSIEVDRLTGRKTFTGRQLIHICTVPASLHCAEAKGETMPDWAKDWEYHRLEIEGVFARFFWSPDRRTWLVQLKSGETMEFGAPRTLSGIDLCSSSIDQGSFTGHHPPDNFRWNLVRRYDTHDKRTPNVVVYCWKTRGIREPTPGEEKRGLNYLTDIFDTYRPGDPNSLWEYAHHVHLIWELPDFPTASYLPIWLATPQLRLQRVDITSKNTAGQGPRELVRRYHLRYLRARTEKYHDNYLTGDLEVREAPFYQQSYLYQVQMEGRCPAPVQEIFRTSKKDVGFVLPNTDCPRLPPVTLEYTDGILAPFFTQMRVGGGRAVPYPGPDAPFTDQSTVAVLDINRDGLADVVHSFPHTITDFNEPHRVFLNVLGPVNDQRLSFAQIDARDVGAALGPTRNSFLSSFFGLSAPGFWGNESGSGVLWGRDLQTSGNREYCRVFSVQGASTPSTPEWVWKINRNKCSSLVPQLHLLGDIDGDGLLDGYSALIGSSGTSSEVHFTRTSLQFVDGPEFVIPFTQTRSSNIVPDIVPGPPPIPPLLSTFADMNGDGLPDYVTTFPSRPRPGERAEIIYYPGDGLGNFTCDNDRQPPSQPCIPPPSLPDPHCPVGSIPNPNCRIPRIIIKAAPDSPMPLPVPDPNPRGTLLFHDVNGDGLADLVLVNPVQPSANRPGGLEVMIWLNEDGQSFRKLRNESSADILVFDLENPRRNLGGSRVAFADMSGEGINEIVLISNDTVRYVNMYFDRPLLKPSPGLLSKMHNGLGLITDITYRHIAELDDEAARWNQPWSFHSPVSSPVVTRIATHDQLPSEFSRKRVVEYQYRDPAYDPWKRRLMGFHNVVVGTSSHDATSYVYFFGPCQRGSACPKTSDNDPWEPLTGVPITVDRFAAGGFITAKDSRLNYSTAHFTYELRTLIKGKDGRFVRFAHQKQVDTYLYDAGNFEKEPTPVKLTTIEKSNETEAVEHEITLWSVRGREHLRRAQVVDDKGNLVTTVDHGRVDDNDNAIDDPIVTTNKYELQGTTGWQWRLTRSKTTSLSGIVEPRSFEYRYYADTGDLKEIIAELSGTLPPDRFHEDPTRFKADNPDGGSQNGSVSLLRLQYDDFGNISLKEGPAVKTTKGLSSGCQFFVYDSAYHQLLRTATRFNGPCGSSGLTTTFDIDRGLEAITGISTPAGARTELEHNEFGRLSVVRTPDPAIGFTAETVPALKLEYFTAKDGPVQKVRLQRRDGPSNYHDSWVYLDGGGRTLLTLREADPSAGDQGSWVGSGLPSRNGVGLISELYTSWFYSGDPAKHPIAPSLPRSAIAGFGYDDLGRLTAVTQGRKLAQGVVYHALSQDFYDGEDSNPASPHVNTPLSVIYDGHGRPVKQVSRLRLGSSLDEIETRLSYLPTGEIYRIEQAHTGGTDMVVRWMEYDSLGRMVLNAESNTSANFSPSPANAQGMKAWRYAYNDAGALVGTSDARGCGANLFYDGFQRLAAVDYSPCHSAHAPYSRPDLLTGDGTEAFYHYDTPEPGQTTDFGSNPFFLTGKLVSVRDQGAHTRFAYDGRGRMIGVARRIVRPGGADSVMQNRYATSWYHSTATFDEADRVVAYSTGADVAELLGSGGASIVTTQYSTRGLVRAVAGSYGTLIASQQYDADGLPRSIEYGDVAATRATIDYDPITKNLSRFSLLRAAPSLWKQPVGAYQPPAAGELTQQTTLEDFQFRYDDAGNLTTIEDRRDPCAWPLGAKPVTRRAAYDNLYRLLSLDYDYGPAGACSTGTDSFVAPFASDPKAASKAVLPWQPTPNRIRQQTFAYDWLGNTTQTRDDANLFYDRSLGPIINGEIINLRTPHQLRTAGSGLRALYDAAGNLVQLIVQRAPTCSSSVGRCTHRFVYDWDEAGRLARARRWDYTAIPPNEPVYPKLPATVPDADLRYSYGLGGRLLKTFTDAKGAESHSAAIFASLVLDGTSWDGTKADFVRTPDTETVYLGEVARVLHAPGLPNVNGPQHVFLQLGDWLGSTSTVIDKDTSELVEKTTYHAFGATESDYRPARWNHFRETYRFTGKEDDFQVGLIYFGARYYHPTLGRWTSADPLTIHALGSDLNPYAYVGGSPLQYVDPVGLDFWDDWRGYVGPPCLGLECGGSGTGVGPIISIQLGPGTSSDFSGSSGSGWGFLSGDSMPQAPPPPPITVPASGVVQSGSNPATGDWLSSALNVAHSLLLNASPVYLGLNLIVRPGKAVEELFLQRAEFVVGVLGMNASHVNGPIKHRDDFDAEAAIIMAATFGRSSAGLGRLMSIQGGGATRLGVGVPRAGGGGGGGEGFTTLYRAVGPAELADIQATGALRNLGSAEGKYFTTSAEAAASYAKQAVRGFGDPPYTLIKTTVPNTTLEGLTPVTVDRRIPAWVIPNNRLPGLTPQVIDSMPLPGP